ncbi:MULTISPECIES: hypothetical protein [Bradyrhizobium]|uniref:hypothetical protein n=1 Tax=Bradyrhizobium TaxID=374 RepID=UPI00155E4FD1|nr:MULTISPECIES: hypothetical protein [Bradyrhizobium]MDD1523392.1 hypothetical protein [Bradyrhizobium sp. WBAH30]MDD1547706.1 hypothetical protein [Bradyrhizobium sp. WBAH41]MDD1561358.1 hypothetical protein [Bradyrhizobium sp. WBAH23]MDD1567326.1 hypothetical protein [Bradyrhizobium sp. WBAH33]MDD1594758.1 hypothetical protein [Bradyrhizobium sp. WBAH42]
MSFRFIEDHRDADPVRLICAVLEVSGAIALSLARVANPRAPYPRWLTKGRRDLRGIHETKKRSRGLFKA